MKNRNELTREVDALREQFSRLSAAILRISASLDVDTVLREIVESARALTGARYGVITTIDEAGQPQDFVASGMTPEQEQLMPVWPDALQLFEHLRGLDAPLRLADLEAYVRSLGLSPGLIPCRTFQGTPMRHGGVHVGNFFLGEKEGGGFTDEDEELLVLFASQAATAIANARTHRDEQRVRADLEALVETSPVGVVVFDAKSCYPMMFNQESRRIVEALRMPGCSPVELLDVLTSRLADGREVSVAEITSAETLRAAEVELSVPDGRSIRMLINVTPIRSAADEIETVVVTMQDLAPLEELDRMRAEFLGMVSHELRTPLAAIKGSTTTVLGASPTLDPAEVDQFFRVIDEQADHMRCLISDLLDAGRINAGTLSVSPVPTDVAGTVDQARNAFLSSGNTHTILIDLPQNLPRVMADRRRIVQVLNNLFSNASGYSPESSPIRVAAVRDGLHVAVSVSDEGRGVPAELLPHLFQKYTGFSSDERGGGLRGSGLGLAICKGLVEAHGGRIWAASGGPGLGTQFTFTLPVAEEAGVEVGSVLDWSGSLPEESQKTPILVVDDDPQTLRFVRDALASAGFSPLVTGDHREVSRIIAAEKPRLILLDLILPGTDGIELMESVPEMADLPVIFISAYGRDETIARALESGAADYLVKPFSATELTARIRAALRKQARPEPFVLGDLAIHYEQRRVSVAGRLVHLTATEYDLLRILSVNAGRVLTYDSLVRQIWSEPDQGDPALVRTFVKQLRRKLGGDPARSDYILNVRGVGYRLASPETP